MSLGRIGGLVSGADHSCAAWSNSLTNERSGRSKIGFLVMLDRLGCCPATSDMVRSASGDIQNAVGLIAWSLNFDLLETPIDQWLTSTGPHFLPSQVG